MEENKNLPQQNNTIMDAIRDKIKGSFVELIPDTNWDAMVKSEVDAFFTQGCEFAVETSNRGYGESAKHHFKFEGVEPTMFRTLVWDLCVEKTREELQKEYVNKTIEIALEERKDENTGEMRNIIQEAVPMMMQKYFENIARGMTNHLAEVIRTTSQNNYNHF